MTTLVTGPSPGRAGPAVRPQIRLGSRWRRAALAVHVLAAGAWIVVDGIVAVLVITGWVADDAGTRELASVALANRVVWPMLTSGLVCLGTGLVLGWSSKWGLLRYWWVAVKLGLNLLLCTLIVLVLRPGMQGMRDQDRALPAGSAPSRDVATLFFPPSMSLALLAFAIVLAVFRPWGRVRPNRSSADRS